jgi:hypothetical protein
MIARELQEIEPRERELRLVIAYASLGPIGAALAFFFCRHIRR